MKASLIVLGVASLACSRIVFALIDDPEGPNLLVVAGLAAIIYFLSLPAYFLSRPMSDRKRFLMALAVQIALAFGFLFFMR